MKKVDFKSTFTIFSEKDSKFSITFILGRSKYTVNRLSSLLQPLGNDKTLPGCHSCKVYTTSSIVYYYLRIRICHSTSRRKCHRASTTVHLFVMDRPTNGYGPMARFIWGWAYLWTERRPSNTKRSTKQCEEQQASSNAPVQLHRFSSGNPSFFFSSGSVTRV